MKLFNLLSKYLSSTDLAMMYPDGPDSAPELDELFTEKPEHLTRFAELLEIASGGKPFTKTYCTENSDDQNTMSEAEASSYFERAETTDLDGEFEYLVVYWVPGEYIEFGWGNTAASAITAAFSH